MHDERMSGTHTISPWLLSKWSAFRFLTRWSLAFFSGVCQKVMQINRTYNNATQKTWWRKKSCFWHGRDSPLALCRWESPRCIDSDWMTHSDSDLSPVKISSKQINNSETHRAFKNKRTQKIHNTQWIVSVYVAYARNYQLWENAHQVTNYREKTGEKPKGEMRFGKTLTPLTSHCIEACISPNNGSLGDACQSNESHQDAAGTAQSGRDT